MQTRVKLPIGVENFEEIRTEGYYYVDKTGLIKDTLNRGGKVTLFTRPRRFGKSLNMSMLKYFFEYGDKKELFEGLEIAKDAKLCEDYMGKFPVISISLKGVEARSYDVARSMLCGIIGREAIRFHFLRKSDNLIEEEKTAYTRLLGDRNSNEDFAMSDTTLMSSLLTLTKLLYKHYGKKVIILIDEYDVPLDKAHQYGYYDEMVSLIRSLLGQVLKTNDSLQMAILTGCLRISKESIFTGLNNFKVCSIKDVEFDEYFGFTDKQVVDLLKYYELEQRHELVKSWYNGYRFGNTDVYCPWDVINYVSQAIYDPDITPKAYWINTSGNAIIRTFLEMANRRTMRELEQLINEEPVEKEIIEELTYQDLYKNIDNLWSVLFTTGYLTQKKVRDGTIVQLKIPNLEIKQIFIQQILKWFENNTRKDTPKLDAFCTAFEKGDAKEVERLLGEYLSRTVGIHDYSIKEKMKENYYHGLLVGLLKHREDWDVYSNSESGTGYSDIIVEMQDEDTGILIETKYPEKGNLENSCKEALRQIEKDHYEDKLINDGMTKVIKYGIAFYKKSCKVEMGEK